MSKKNAAGPAMVWIAHNAHTPSLWVPILGGVDVKRGEPVEAPSEIAERLTMQDIWTEVPAPAGNTNDAENGAEA